MRKDSKHTTETKKKISSSMHDMFCMMGYHELVNGKCIWCGLKEKCEMTLQKRR